MSISIPQSYVEQFSSNVHLLSEQRTSRLRGTVMIEDVTGESFAVERVGGIDAPNQITNLHGDTPLNNTPHTRRWGFIADYDVADLIDKQSRVRLLIDPDSIYTLRHAGTMGRGVDDSIIAALGGNAAQGKSGTSNIALPSGQKIANGSTNLTISKLIEAKEKLDAAEVDDYIPRFFVAGSSQMSALLEDDKITSSDFNTVRALVRGELNEYLGFTFVRSERLPVGNIGANIRQCYAWAMTGVRLGVAMEPNSVASPRPDKRNSMQIYTCGSWGAVRVEDEQVVEVACDES